MARQRKRRAPARKNNDDYPGWVWMLFGLAIGLSVAFAIYVRDREPLVIARQTPPPEPASMQSALDDNDETPAAQTDDAAAKRRFDFYDMLPAFEMEVDDVDETVSSPQAPVAVEEPGVYILQAGSFSTPQDADRRRGELALQGIESYVQRAQVNGRDYHRVYIGPIDDLDELNLTRSRLRAAKIDALRIRIVE